MTRLAERAAILTGGAKGSAAIVAFTRSLSRAVGGHGICVNTLVGLHHERQPDGIQSRPCGDSDFVTGQTIAVDGGAVNT